MKRPGTTTFLENILRLKQFDRMVMAFYFKPSDREGKNLFMLGGFSPKYYKGQMKYHIVDDECYWKLHITEIRIGKVSLEFCSNGCYAFLDTGTSYLSFPNYVADNVKNTILDQFKSNLKKTKSAPNLMYFLL